MLDKTEVSAFFDRLAPSWDGECHHDPEKIAAILDYAGIQTGVTVLDVACGTGVLFPYYLERGVKHVTGVDISRGMIDQAGAKFTDPRISLVCADIESADFTEPFDRCVVYCSFPHFGDPGRLIARLARTLSPGGRLTVAHSESKEEIDHRHMHHANRVSIGLLPADELSKLFTQFFAVDTAVSNEKMYVVSGTKV
jgi:ubiquinone/menaquinone biosynthesis C-methylase UbiE